MAGGRSTAEIEAARRLLAVAPDADARALRLAYLAAVKTAHPDRAGGDSTRLRQVIEAYGRLKAAARAPEPPPAPDILTITPAQAMRGGVAEVALGAGRLARTDLPAGLRHGDIVRLSGQSFRVFIRGGRDAAVLGDHLCVTVAVDAAVLRHGGRLTIDTPTGPAGLWVSAGDAARGLVRRPGDGLPARGDRPAGDLFVRLIPAAAATQDRPARAKLRRFAARWAA
jgi:curved DNA-binding protein